MSLIILTAVEINRSRLRASHRAWFLQAICWAERKRAKKNLELITSTLLTRVLGKEARRRLAGVPSFELKSVADRPRRRWRRPQSEFVAVFKDL
jgi:hypothetical protein